MTDTPDVQDVVKPIELSVHARRTGGSAGWDKAWIYVNTNIVFKVSDFAWNTPAGIDDFANVAVKRFAEKLARIRLLDTVL